MNPPPLLWLLDLVFWYNEIQKWYALNFGWVCNSGATGGALMVFREGVH
jgi:hypothetical protein